MSERPNTEILANLSLLTVMSIISYQIKQHLNNIHIGEVLAHRGHGELSLTGS